MKIQNLQQKKWYIMDSEPNGNYSKDEEIKFLARSIESSRCDYSDAYILVIENINVTGGDNNTKVAFKNCAPFQKCKTEINETFIDEAEHINIAMPMYNLIEYSDNYSDTSGSLWQFKRDEIKENVDLTLDTNHIPNNSSSFKYKSSYITNRYGVKMYNCKVKLSLKWHENCKLSSEDGNSVFTITDTKRYVPIITLRTEYNTKLSKLLSDGFKRWIKWWIYRNKYKTIPNNTYAANDNIRELLDSSYQGVKRLFVLAYDSTGGIAVDSHKRYFLPRVKIENYNIEIDGNFYYQPVNDFIKQYDEISRGQGDDYTTGFLLDFAYFEKIID